MSHSKLILRAFEEAKKDLQSQDGRTQIPNSQIAQHISDYVCEQEENYTIGERRLRDYHSGAQNGKIEISDKRLIECLAKYVRYKDYKAFAASLHGDLVYKKKNYNNQRAFKIALVGFVFGLIAISGVYYFSESSKRWMQWQEDRYVEVDFNEKLFEDGKLMIFDQHLIDYFRKIVPTCDHALNYYYGKGLDGNYEYYTELSTHPLTHKALKEMTDYMREKYVCGD